MKTRPIVIKKRKLNNGLSSKTSIAIADDGAKLLFDPQAPDPIDPKQDLTVQDNRYTPTQTRFWRQLSYNDFSALQQLQEHCEYKEFDDGDDLIDQQTEQEYNDELKEAVDTHQHDSKSKELLFLAVNRWQVQWIGTAQQHKGLFLRTTVFRDLVDELLEQENVQLDIDDKTVCALQFAAEAFLTDLLSSANMVSYHRDRQVTLMPSKMREQVEQLKQKGYICPFDCTVHRPEARRAMWQLIHESDLAAALPTVLFPLIDQFLPACSSQEDIFCPYKQIR